MANNSFEGATNTKKQKEEVPLPEDAPALADWIEEELGDEELAQFLRTHPEGAELLPNGECLLPRTVFDVVEDLKSIEPSLAQELVHTLDEKAMLPEVSYERIVGSLPSDEMPDVLLRKKYELAQDRLALRSGELEKRVHQRVFIQEANNALVRLRAKYGLPEFIVPEEAVRFIAGARGARGMPQRSPDALFTPTEQSADFSAGRNPIEEFNDLFHELTHFHSYCAVQVDRKEDGNERFEYYRIGLQTHPRQQDGFRRISKYLNALNEAVTEETANRLVMEIPDDDPVLGEFAQYRHGIASYLETEPDFLLRNGLRSHWVTHGTPTERGMGWNYSYKEERNTMFALLKEIYERNPERFQGKSSQEAEDELFEMLQKAMFTGNILPFGRLFNETFGRGKFREYGHLQTIEEQQSFVEGL